MIERLKFRGKVASICSYSPSAITRAMALLTEGEWFIAESPYVLAQFFTLIDRGKIDPPTVSQWTGLKDSKGVEIYEGDVVYLAGYGDYEVEFPFGELYSAGAENDIGKIIGTIHDKEQA